MHAKGLARSIYEKPSPFNYHWLIMEIPLLNSSASSLSPKELHSLTKREASSQSNSSTGFTQKSTDLSSSSCSHLEIEEIKESANLIKKSAESKHQLILSQ